MFKNLIEKMHEEKSQNESLQADTVHRDSEMSTKDCLQWDHEEQLGHIPVLEVDLLKAMHNLREQNSIISSMKSNKKGAK
jgi:hypothetical protein